MARPIRRRPTRGRCSACSRCTAAISSPRNPTPGAPWRFAPRHSEQTTRIANSVDMLGGALRRLGRNDEGERYMRRAIVLYEHDKGPNDVSLVVPLTRLADAVATDHEDYAEAARLMERGLAIAKASFGEGHPRTAYALEFLWRIGVASRQLREGRATVAPRGRNLRSNARQTRRRGGRRLRGSREGVLARRPVVRRRGDARRAITVSKPRSDERTRRMAGRLEDSARSTCTPVGSPRRRPNAERCSRFVSARWETAISG